MSGVVNNQAVSHELKCHRKCGQIETVNFISFVSLLKVAVIHFFAKEYTPLHTQQLLRLASAK